MVDLPRWIDHQSGKAERQKAAHEALVARAMRHKAEAGEREAFRREQEERRSEPVPRRGIQPGERRIVLSDEQLAEALAKADRAIPRMLDYPHLLMLRERGFTRQVWADRGAGEFGAATYRGDVITEVGMKWLKQRE